jgi:hypothetical protein
MRSTRFRPRLATHDHAPPETRNEGVRGSSPRVGFALRAHVTQILQKLDLRDRVQAVVLAYQAGLFEADVNTLGARDERPPR